MNPNHTKVRRVCEASVNMRDAGQFILLTSIGTGARNIKQAGSGKEEINFQG